MRTDFPATNRIGHDMDEPIAHNSKGEYLIRILDTGETFYCAKDKEILKAMTALGRRGIPSGCHGGGCGICKIQIVSGQIESGLMSRAHISEAEQANGTVLACKTRPRSPIELKVVGLLRNKVVRPAVISS